MTNRISRADGLIIQTDTADLELDAMQKHGAWLDDPHSAEKKLNFASALKRWGQAAHKRDAVEHAERLLSGEL